MVNFLQFDIVRSATSLSSNKRHVVPFKNSNRSEELETVKRKTVLSSIFVFLVTSMIWAQDSRGTAQASFGGKNVEIEYGRPALKGRDMLSRLPVGGSWRMGMNTATTLKTEATLVFGSESVAAGDYRLTAKRVGENDWHLVISKDSGSVEVPLVTKTSTDSVETLSIELEAKSAAQGEFRMAWGTLSVSTTFAVK